MERATRRSAPDRYRSNAEAFGMTFRFAEEAVLRLLWRKEANDWRVTSYDAEVP